MSFKQGLFNRDTMMVKFGGERSVDKNRFTALAIKVPDFNYTVTERADAGGGWYYNHTETVTRTENNAYIIIRDNIVIGWMTPSCGYWHNLKTDLYPMDWHGTRYQIKEFAEKYLRQVHTS